MTQASITINASPGSNTDLPINTLVTLGNVNNGGELTYSWSILEQPPGPVVNLSSSTAPSPTFTPTKQGSYLIQLIVNVGLPDERRNKVIAAVRQLKTRTRIPAAGEEIEVNSTKGWSLSANELLRIVDSLRADPFITVAQLGFAAAVGDCVQFTGSAVLMTGLPEQQNIPVVTLTTGLASPAGRFGVVEGPVGGSLGLGQLAYIRTGGLVSATVPALTPLSSPVYVSNSGALSIVPGSVVRQVGRLVALTGTSGQVYIDGLQASSSSGNSALFMFNNQDVSQFDLTPATSGTPVNPQLTFGGGALVLSMDVGSGANSQIIWWVDSTTVPWSLIRKMRFVITPTPGVTPTDAYRIGIVAGGDRSLGTGMAYVVNTANEFNVGIANGSSPGALLTTIPIVLSSVIVVEIDFATNYLDATTFTPNGVPSYVGTAEITTLADPVVKQAIFSSSGIGFAGPDWGPAVPAELGVTLQCPSGVVDPVGVSVNIAAFAVMG